MTGSTFSSEVDTGSRQEPKVREANTRPTKNLERGFTLATGAIFLSSTQCQMHEDVERIPILDFRG